MLRELEGHTDHVNSVAFSPDGRWLASGSDDGTVKVWSTKDGLLIKELDAVSRGAASRGVYGVAFSTDGRLLASGNTTIPSVVHLWDTADWSLRQTLKGFTSSVNNVSFSPAGDLLACAADWGIVRLWSVADQRFLGWMGGDGYVKRIVFTPDGGGVVVGLTNGVIKIWDIADDRRTRTLKMSVAGGSALDLSPNGQWLAWGNRAGEIELIRFADGVRIQTLIGHQALVMSVVFSPDSRLLATADDSGVIKLWQR